MDMKQCSTCQQVKPLSEFHRHRQLKSGYRPRCKTCRRAELRDYYRANPERYKAYHQKERSKPDYHAKKRAIAARWKERYPGRYARILADCHLKRKYGISLATKEILLAAQNGCCRLCGSPSPRTKAGWHTDHDHITNVVRGIVCDPCNGIIGRLERHILPTMTAEEFFNRLSSYLA